MGTFEPGGINCGTTGTLQTGSPLSNPPPPAGVQPKPINGSIVSVFGIDLFSYTAYPYIESLTLGWTAWVAGTDSVEIDATLSAIIYVHISGAPLVVNPAITITRLPVTMHFGSASDGSATLQASDVSVGNPSDYDTVDNCGAADWCNGIVQGAINKSLQAAFQSMLVEQMVPALNNAGPFWFVLMSQVATTSPGALTDPAGNQLPAPGSSSLAGSPTTWQELTYEGFASSQVRASFTTNGLCYLDCVSKTCQEQGFTCGTQGDGCGNPIQCGSCPSGDVCTAGTCEVCVKETCASFHASCGNIPDGCGGEVACGTCASEYTCQNGACVGTGGSSGSFCAECKKTGGVCHTGSSGDVLYSQPAGALAAFSKARSTL